MADKRVKLSAADRMPQMLKGRAVAKWRGECRRSGHQRCSLDGVHTCKIEMRFYAEESRVGDLRYIPMKGRGLTVPKDENLDSKSDSISARQAELAHGRGQGPNGKSIA